MNDNDYDPFWVTRKLFDMNLKIKKIEIEQDKIRIAIEEQKKRRENGEKDNWVFGFFNWIMVSRRRNRGRIKMRKWTDENIIEWHEKTFPKIDILKQVEKVNEEILEFEKEKRSVYFSNNQSKNFYLEMADVYISSVGLKRFFPAISRAIQLSIPAPFTLILDRYIDEKMEINKDRVFRNNRHEVWNELR